MQQRITQPLRRRAWAAGLLAALLLAFGVGPASAAATPTKTDAQAVAERQAPAAVVASDVKGKTFTIATDTTFAPFEFRDPSTGELVGIDMDILRAIAKDQGFEVNIQSLGFHQIRRTRTPDIG